MSRILIGLGAVLILVSLGWAGLLVWRLQEGGVGPSDGETAVVVVSFNWVLLVGAIGLLVLSAGLLARMTAAKQAASLTAQVRA